MHDHVGNGWARQQAPHGQGIGPVVDSITRPPSVLHSLQLLQAQRTRLWALHCRGMCAKGCAPCCRHEHSAGGCGLEGMPLRHKQLSSSRLQKGTRQ